MAVSRSPKGLLWLLGILSGLVRCLAQAGPEMVFPLGTQQQAVDEMNQALRDAMTIARFVAITSTPCEDAFLRYFQPQDYLFVQRVFRTVANIPFDQQFDTSNVAQILQFMASQSMPLNPKFADLSISLDVHPAIRPQDLTYTCKGTNMDGFATYKPSVYGNRVLMSICPLTFDMYYSLHDIENPPAWALSEPGGQPEVGFGCENILDHDSTYMMTPGSVILHELMHWPYLLQDIPGYHAVTVPHPDGFTWILDWPGPVPPDGYGPCNCAQLKDFGLNPHFMYTSEAVRNADNFVWYAMSKYWTWKCQRPFGPSTSTADDKLRLGSFDDGVMGEDGNDDDGDSHDDWDMRA